MKMRLDIFKHRRLKGEVFKESVFVSLVGDLNVQNPVILLSRNDYDFRPLIGMDVWIYTNNAGANFAKTLAEKIMSINPSWLRVSNIDTQKTLIYVMNYEEVMIPGGFWLDIKKHANSQT